MSSACLIDGKAEAVQLRRAVASAAAELWRRRGVRPGLATILVGDDPASQVYVRSKGRACEEAGLASFHHALPADTGEAAVVDLIAGLNRDDRIDGILVQLPLPAGLDAARVVAAVDPGKDVDGFHPVNIGLMWSGRPALIPCTPEGCLRLLRRVHPDMSGAEAVVLGRSSIVGRPVAALLIAENCTVTLAHSRSRDLPSICRRGDILVAAVGRPELVKADWIKPGATVIDIGINRVSDGAIAKLVGDVDFAAARGVAGAITPVPGGVGPMTIACLLRNTMLAACRRRDLPDPGELH